MSAIYLFDKLPLNVTFKEVSMLMWLIEPHLSSLLNLRKLGLIVEIKQNLSVYWSTNSEEKLKNINSVESSVSFSVQINPSNKLISHQHFSTEGSHLLIDHLKISIFGYTCLTTYRECLHWHLAIQILSSNLFK